MPREKLINKITVSSQVRLIIFCILILGIIELFLDKQKEPVPYTEQIPVIRAVSPIEIFRGDTSKEQVIFTFDGGDKDICGAKVISVLDKHGVEGSFFLTGRFVKSNPDIVREMHRKGHGIYNHTYNHPYMTRISDEQMEKELEDMDKELFNLTGQSSRPYWRPPYGNRDQRVVSLAAKAGYRPILWTVDAMDWRESEGIQAEEVKYIILSSLAPGNIYLMHLGDTITGSILDELFTEIESRGYKIVSLRQGL